MSLDLGLTEVNEVSYRSEHDVILVERLPHSVVGVFQ